MMTAFIQKLEAALKRRTLPRSRGVDKFNVRCECCDTNIPHYIGLQPGALCRNCYQPVWELGYCGNPNSSNPSGDRDYELPDNYL